MTSSKEACFLPIEGIQTMEGFRPRSSSPSYLSLAHKPPCTSKGPHNMTWTKKYLAREHKHKTRKKYEHGLSSKGRAKPEKCAKNKLRLSLPKMHHLFAVARETPNPTCNMKGRSPPMVGKMRLSISSSPMMAPNSSIVGHSSTPLKRKTCWVGTQ